jgi:hypothetical protein
MVAALIDDPVLARFRQELDGMYGDCLERIVLFGSRARGMRMRSLITMWRSSCTT